MRGGEQRKVRDSTGGRKTPSTDEGMEAQGGTHSRSKKPWALHLMKTQSKNRELTIGLDKK